MTRLEAWLFHLSTILLGITGLAYAWMRYIMETQDPFSVVNHPWEPYMLSIHILAAPLLVVCFGLILHGHILFKIAGGSRTARKTGLVLIPAFVIMVLSGYLLQVITSDFRKVLVVVHLVSGTLWLLFYLGHQIASLAQRRARVNGNRLRYPVQMLLIGILTLASQSFAEPFEREVYTMGTTLRVVMLESDRQKALEDTEELIRVIEQADSQLSTWKSTSELSLLNAASEGRPVPVSRSLFQLLEQMQTWAVRTGRAFDPGIGRLIKAWGIHETVRTPSEPELADARKLSGIHLLHLDRGSFTITKTANIWIDPGAFGKGEALDRAIAAARKRKMAPLMMDFGGQIAVSGPPRNKNGWLAYLADAQKRLPLAEQEIVLTEGSLSTSGYSEQFKHILDPSTGLPAAQFGSVTVWHHQALVADILSTALYVMGPVKGYEWAVQNEIAAAFITKSKVKKTEAFLRVLALP